MSKTVKYTDEPFGDIKIIKDLLPSPKDDKKFIEYLCK